MSQFQFKQFAIAQENCAMKVGLDGVLVGSWAVFEQPKRLLDIGTGTGLLALMLAQRYPLAEIDAVEIDPLAAHQAAENVANSLFRSRIKVIETSINGFSENEGQVYDAIISNPPFFEVGIAPTPTARATARHTTTLSHTDLLQAVKRLLTPKGIFVVILPTTIATNFILKAANLGLYITKRTNVWMRPQKEPTRVLLAFTPIFKVAALEELTIYTATGNSYTPEFRALTADFYL